MEPKIRCVERFFRVISLFLYRVVPLDVAYLWPFGVGTKSKRKNAELG